MDFKDLRYRFTIELENWPPTTGRFDHYWENFLLQQGASQRLSAAQKLELRQTFAEAIMLNGISRRAP